MIIVISKTNFNSIKVRLKLVKALTQNYNVQSFQFHKGTIKTFSYSCSSL